MLKATPLSFSCVLKRRVFVINSLVYDACFEEKSQDLIFPQESISFDSNGFYNTFRFTSLRGRDFVPEKGGFARPLANSTGFSGSHLEVSPLPPPLVMVDIAYLIIRDAYCPGSRGCLP